MTGSTRRSRSASLQIGYAQEAYVRSLAEFGDPLALPASHGWLLERCVPGTTERDAMGPYPLFGCGRWRSLGEDLAALGRGLASVTLVPDPFGDWDETMLRDTFDVARPYKRHLVADMTRPVDSFVTGHHRYYARRAMREIDVSVNLDPLAALDDWTRLYGHLVRRHSIGGIRAFSAASFAAQLALPGMVMLVARQRGVTVGAHLWLVSGSVAYSHLAASDDAGYRAGAAYALHAFALDYFRGRVAWLDLGAGAGLATPAGAAAPRDGLTAFKAGWSTGSRLVYLCGRVLSPDVYATLCRRRGVDATPGADAYFPAYRADEFGATKPVAAR
jgi:hypothetical protein